MNHHQPHNSEPDEVIAQRDPKSANLRFKLRCNCPCHAHAMPMSCPCSSHFAPGRKIPIRVASSVNCRIPLRMMDLASRHWLLKIGDWAYPLVIEQFICELENHLSIAFSGWWLSHPSEKYEFVSWDNYSQLNGKS